ncbi:BTB domain-containing protein [Mycena venus]|uniref:BTB domain-containing protein n=1 Tax=Mycena venus TaxID=2733690 RepID=A0A8H6XMD1_9AGAR|nr:BTB domain-containing protein [Mycena venus]
MGWTSLPLIAGASHERSVQISVEALWHQTMSSPASSQFSSRSSSPLSPASPPSPQSVAATPGPDWSPRPGMPSIGLPNGSLPGSTAVSPSWSPAQGSLILGVDSPPPSLRSSSSSGDLLDEAISKYPDTAAVACTINPRYYFDDQISYFKVENQIFKIHRHFLVRDSIYFQELFAGPLGDFGMRESEAIPLEEVGVAEFECLLDFFYNGMYRQSTFSLSQWITLLSVSSRLGFDLLRAQAIQSIEESPTTFDPIDKLVLAMRYKIPEWLGPAYTALCQRPNCLEEWEAEKIGLKKTVQIARAREAFREASYRSRAPSPVFCWPPPGQTPSPVLKPMVDYQATRAARIVDEVFFP